MKFEAGQLNLVLKPENDNDVYNLGIIGTKIKSRTQFNTIKGDEKVLKNAECQSMLIEYKELIKFLITANAKSL